MEHDANPPPAIIVSAFQQAGEREAWLGRGTAARAGAAVDVRGQFRDQAAITKCFALAESRRVLDEWDPFELEGETSFEDPLLRASRLQHQARVEILGRDPCVMILRNQTFLVEESGTHPAPAA